LFARIGSSWWFDSLGSSSIVAKEAAWRARFSALVMAEFLRNQGILEKV